MLDIILALSPGRGLETSALANTGETNELAPNPKILLPATGLFDSTTTRLQEGCATRVLHAWIERSAPINSCPIAGGWIAMHSRKSSCVSRRQVILISRGNCKSWGLK